MDVTGNGSFFCRLVLPKLPGTVVRSELELQISKRVRGRVALLSVNLRASGDGRSDYAAKCRPTMG